MDYCFRKATTDDIHQIWEILQSAILRRKADGSNQWQDGYPNLDVVAKDVEKQVGYVLATEDRVIGYVAILINDEPAYTQIEGHWLTNSDFVVLHRVAVSENFLGKGIAQELFRKAEELALRNNIYSIKVDTNFDNIPMLRVFEKLGYVYCGEVHLRGNARKAFEKVLVDL